MPLPAKVEKLDAVPEAQRSLYKELGDGKGFILDVEGAEDVFAVGLKKNRDDALTEKKKLQGQLKEFEDLGLTAEEAKKMVEARRAAEETNAQKAGEWEKLKTQLIDKHNGDLSKATARETKLLKVIEKNLASKEAATAITKLGGSSALLLPHVMDEIRVVEDGDDFKAIVVAKDGKTPRIKNGSGDPMSIEDLVAEFKERKEYGQAFGAPGASGSGGSGSKGDGGGGSGGGANKGGTISISRADAKNAQLYQAAKARAEKEGKELAYTD